MNLNNKTAKKDLHLAYSQGNNTAYPPNIEAMAKYLSTQYSNNKPANQRGGKKKDKKKGADSNLKTRIVTQGVLSAHMLKTLRQLNTSLFLLELLSQALAHVLETNVQSSNSPHIVEEILGAHPMDNDCFWGNTNPTNLSINTANSEEMIAGNHSTEFHTPKQEEPVTTELLNKVSNVPEVTRKHGAGQGHHNKSDPQSAKSADCKLNTHVVESFSSNTIGNGGVARIMGKTLDMAGGYISDMLPKSSYLQAPTIVEDSNKTTNRNEMGDLKPTAIDKNNNNSVELTNIISEPNNILGAHILEEKD